jgi:hypothetical protein
MDGRWRAAKSVNNDRSDFDPARQQSFWSGFTRRQGAIGPAESGLASDDWEWLTNRKARRVAHKMGFVEIFYSNDYCLFLV